MLVGRSPSIPALCGWWMDGVRQARHQVEFGAQPELGVAAGPIIVEAVALALHPRLDLETLPRREPEAGPDAQGAGLVIGGEVLVEDQDRLDPHVLEEGVPARLVAEDLTQQVRDRVEVEAQ